MSADTERGPGVGQYARVPVNRDPRRLGLAALGLAVAYAVSLFIEQPLPVKAGVGAILGAALVAGALLLPLPEWREPENRKRTAAVAMVVEACVAVALVTLVRVVSR
jgi:hypothetical protein